MMIVSVPVGQRFKVLGLALDAHCLVIRRRHRYAFRRSRLLQTRGSIENRAVTMYGGFPVHIKANGQSAI